MQQIRRAGRRLAREDRIERATEPPVHGRPQFGRSRRARQRDRAQSRGAERGKTGRELSIGSRRTRVTARRGRERMRCGASVYSAIAASNPTGHSRFSSRSIHDENVNVRSLGRRRSRISGDRRHHHSPALGVSRRRVADDSRAGGVLPRAIRHAERRTTYDGRSPPARFCR